MPREHLREDGKLSQGMFCLTCGQPCGMMGHTECEPNRELVNKLVKINQAGSVEAYVFNKLKAKDNE